MQMLLPTINPMGVWSPGFICIFNVVSLRAVVNGVDTAVVALKRT